MNTNTQPQKRHDNVIASLNAAIDILNIAKEASGITPAKVVFGSVSVLLGMIKVHPLPFCAAEFSIHMCLGFHGQPSDYVALGLTCAAICAAIEQGMDGKELNDLNEPVRKAIKQLKRWVRPQIYISRDPLSSSSTPGP